jgi:hypothetical protein
LLGTGIDDHALILLIDHRRNKRLLDVENPEYIHIKDGLPGVKTVPRGTLQTDSSVVHQNRDLDKDEYRLWVGCCDGGFGGGDYEIEIYNYSYDRNTGGRVRIRSRAIEIEIGR